MRIENTLKLSELSALVKETLENSFRNRYFWIIGEVSNHVYKADKAFHHFELIEKSDDAKVIVSRIPAKAWGDGSRHIKNFEQITGQIFTQNIQVLLKVEVTYHEVFGLSLQILDIDTKFTLGLLEEQRQNTLLKLVTQNSFIKKVGDQYFTRNKSLPTSRVIQKIALLTSSTSAGVEDFQHTLLHNPYAYKFDITLFHSVVQGAQNASALREKLIDIFEEYEKGKAFDAVVIVRGGGSQTDFLIFDDYYLAQAVAKFPIPIITGIGHQKNETIVDLMAHTATKTPTQAAEHILYINRKFEEELISKQKDILIKVQDLFSKKQLELQKLQSYLGHSPLLFLQKQSMELQSIRDYLPQNVLMFIKNEKQYINHYQKLIHVLSPENVLKRGFAYIKKGDKILNSSNPVTEGDRVEVHLYQKKLEVLVEKIEKRNGK